MRRTLALAALLSGCLMPGIAAASSNSMTAAEARHLISRTGFGVSPQEINAMIGLTYREGIDRVMADLGGDPSIAMPSWVDDWAYPYDQIWTLDQTTTELFYANRWVELEDLTAWWLAEMTATPSPLTERLVLLWSDHFASSFESHGNSQWIARQNRFFRTHAAGNSTDLAAGILNDPAMLVYLDNMSNIAEAPNENLGREFLELFTLGEGRGYTQNDVRGAARILTGTRLTTNGAPKVILDKATFDAGEKTLFGQTGHYLVADLVEMTLNHPDFGSYIVEKLWLTFVSDIPDLAEVARLTTLWRDNDLAIVPLLEALFLTDAFWDVSNRGRLVKSPIEMLIGTTRRFGLWFADGRELVWMLNDLGQQPFMPPNVSGWPEGIAWINDATASGRATALTQLLADRALPADGPVVAEDTGTSQDIVTADADDLRVGQVFVTYIETRDPGDGYGGTYTLYDVGFGGHDWRSITFWMEFDESEDFTNLYLYTGDCAPDCFANLPKDDDDPGWVGFVLREGFTVEYPEVSGQDFALMRAIGTHLPALVARTKNQMPYRANPDGADQIGTKFSNMILASKQFAHDSDALLGPQKGHLVHGFSRRNVLGLSGSDQVMSGMDVSTYVDQTAEARAIPLRPTVAYNTAQDWINALPGTGPQSARAAKTLRAVPRVQQGLRDELIVQDADALLRRLVLSPAYQIN